jgi:protein-tyrosine phosphatase
VSIWFRTHGYASVGDRLIVGALPLDQDDVRMLAALGVSRVLNLVEDREYPRGARRKVERALAAQQIAELRLGTEDYAGLSPALLEQATAQVNSWLDDGEVVYLHCRAGWQRSAAVAAGAIALRGGLEPQTALLQVQELKPSADPLPHQREDLQRWFDARAEGPSQSSQPA